MKTIIHIMFLVSLSLFSCKKKEVKVSEPNCNDVKTSGELRNGNYISAYINNASQYPISIKFVKDNCPNTEITYEVSNLASCFAKWGTSIVASTFTFNIDESQDKGNGDNIQVYYEPDYLYISAMQTNDKYSAYHKFKR